MGRNLESVNLESIIYNLGNEGMERREFRVRGSGFGVQMMERGCGRDSSLLDVAQNDRRAWH